MLIQEVGFDIVSIFPLRWLAYVVLIAVALGLYVYLLSRRSRQDRSNS